MPPTKAQHLFTPLQFPPPIHLHSTDHYSTHLCCGPVQLFVQLLCDRRHVKEDPEKGESKRPIVCTLEQAVSKLNSSNRNTFSPFRFFLPKKPYETRIVGDTETVHSLPVSLPDLHTRQSSHTAHRTALLEEERAIRDKMTKMAVPLFI